MKQLILSLTILLTIFAPIYTLLWLIVVVSSIDLIAAIHKDFIKHKEIKGFWKKIKLIKSRKLRRTFTKTSYYLIVVMLLYAIPFVCFDVPTFALWISKFAGFSILAHEMFSIGENINLITGNNIISKVIKKSFKRLSEWTNKKMEDPEK